MANESSIWEGIDKVKLTEEEMDTIVEKWRRETCQELGERPDTAPDIDLNIVINARA